MVLQIEDRKGLGVMIVGATISGPGGAYGGPGLSEARKNVPAYVALSTYSVWRQNLLNYHPFVGNCCSRVRLQWHKETNLCEHSSM